MQSSLKHESCSRHGHDRNSFLKEIGFEDCAIGRAVATSIDRSSEQLFDFTDAKVDQREGTSRGSGQLGMQIQAKAFENAGDDLTWVGRSVGRNRADRIACTDRAATLDAAAGKRAGETLRPMVPSTGRIDLRRAAKFGQGRRPSCRRACPAHPGR